MCACAAKITKEKEDLNLKGSEGWRQEELKGGRRRNDINIIFLYKILKNNYFN